MSGREVLLRAAALIERGGWIQGSFARDRDGQPCLPESEFAAQWCIAGALRAVAQDDCDAKRQAQLGLLHHIQQTLHEHDSVTRWNDAPYRTQAEAVAALRAAAEAAKEARA